MPQANRTEKFLADLNKFVGATTWQGSTVFVSQGAPLTFEPCKYDVAVLEEVLKSGKAEKRVLTVSSPGKLEHRIEIVAAR